ncbi:MAG TPA: YrbL family protein [Rhodanobacteraceae bacterium]|nr:YrbL family protein [Rhodanobacteraceae bacterium]
MPTDSPTAPPLALASAAPLAVGHLRNVFQHPEHEGELIKIMRPEAVASRWNGPRRWHKRLPRTRHYVGYLRELKEYIGARARAPEVDAPIARMLGVVETDLGLGLVSEKVVDGEGALAPTLAAVYGRRGFTPELETALGQFLKGLLDANVIVGDMHAWNIVYGSDSRGGPRLVMIDGFGEKHAIPVSSMSRGINRYRTHRLYRRMLEQLERLVPVER